MSLTLTARTDKGYMDCPTDRAGEASSLSQDRVDSRPRFPEWIFPIVGVFFFFTLVGSISQIIPGLYSDLQAFFLNFRLVSVPNTGITMPAPADPAMHIAVYGAAAIFCLAWGFYAIVMLILRLIARSPPRRTAQEFSSMVWWFGAWFLIGAFLNASVTLVGYFAFWAAIIMLIGGSLMVRAIVLAIIK
jgi:hypothetical protein